MSVKHITSIRSIFNYSIVGYLSVFILTSSILVSFFIAQHYQNSLFDSTRQLANTVSSFSLQYLKDKSSENIKQSETPLYNKLTELSELTTLKHIHIYRVDDVSNQIGFFISYRYKTIDGYSGNPNDIKDVQAFSVPQSSKSGIELIVPIADNEKIYGYVYIQRNNKSYYQLINSLAIATLVLLFISLALGFYISSRLSRQVLKPIGSMVETTQLITQTKDFSRVYDEMPNRETDILARNINIMLTRVQKHIEKLSEAEQDSKALNVELEQKVETRTSALKESNQELLSTLEKLHQFQGQLVEEKKMASLGDMVAGVAHEVNTPIGLGVTASTLLADKMAEIKGSFEDKTLKSSQLKKFLNEGEENIDIICRNLTRAADLISSFKKVAVDQSSDNLLQFNVYDLIQEVILTLAPKLDKTHVNIEIDCPRNLTVTSKPGPINQIFINLIINSLIHGFEGKESGIISINVLSLSSQLSIQYKDNGVGIASSIEKRIFEPFATTKRGSGGSGLGLHLVYNLVTQALGGSIVLHNEHKTGVNFEICFPTY